MLDIKAIHTPTTLDEALDLMSREILHPMAGGTDLLVEMRNKVMDNTSIIALGRLDELRGIRLDDEGLFIGPLTTFTELTESDLIKEKMPVLAEAALTIAGPQIRNVATLGGNVANGAVSADSIPALLLYDTTVKLQSKDEVRYLPLIEIFTGPGKTILTDGELLTGFYIPAENLGRLSARYIKYSVRKSMDLAVLGVGVALTLQDGVIEKLRCALGVAAPVPLRLLSDSDWAGRTPDDSLIEDIITAIEGEIQLRDSWRASKEYREHLIKVLVREAFLDCLAQAEDKTNE